MEDCPSDLSGVNVKLKLSAYPTLAMVAAASSEAMAQSAGLGSHASLRCRLITEEIFLHVSSQCGHNLQNCELKIKYSVSPDGLEIKFSSSYLTYDPQSLPEYSIEALLRGEETDGLGLHLVKAYAKKISLARKGIERELTILMGPGEGETGSRPWQRLIPSMASGLSLSPMEHEGKRVHRLDTGPEGKTYLVRALAWQVLGLIDGQTDFASIMAQTLKVMPESKRHQVEDLFEALIDKGLVILRELPRPQAEVEIVPDDSDPRAQRAIKAYEALRPKEKPKPEPMEESTIEVDLGPD